MSPDPRAESFGAALCAAVFLVGILSALDVFGATATHSIEVANSAPVVSGVSLNHGGAITLTPNTTTTVDINFTISDNNGCETVFSSGTVAVYVYRSGIGSSTASTSSSTLNSYWGTITTSSCSAGNASGAATATVDIWYFAQATDASSSFSSQTWMATVSASDPSSTTSSVDSSGVELNTLLGVGVATGTLSYGSLSPGATSTGDFPTTLFNAGNSSTSLQISGTALASGGNIIGTSSQHYATSTFTYGGAEQALSGTATDVPGFLVSSLLSTAGQAISGWNASTSAVGCASYNDRLYAYGGSASSNPTSTTYVATVGSGGTLSSWATTSPLATAAYSGGSAAYGRFVYLTGGVTGPVTNLVQFAAVNSDGTLGAWATTTPLPSVNYQHASVAANGYLYVIGGGDSGNSTSTVRFASINATGSIGSWTDTTPLPSQLYIPRAVTYNSRIYVVGGSNSGTATSTVLYATINATGSISAWQSAPSLPTSTSRHVAWTDGRMVYSSGAFVTTSIRFAPIRTDGSLGPWSSAGSLPFLRLDGCGATANGYGYMVSGGNVTSTLSVPFYARDTYWGLQAPAGKPQGTYSGVTTYTAVFQP